MCGREFCEYGFVKGLLLGYLHGRFLGRVIGCELRAADGVDPGWVIWKEFWSEITD